MESEDRIYVIGQGKGRFRSFSVLLYVKTCQKLHTVAGARRSLAYHTSYLAITCWKGLNHPIHLHAVQQKLGSPVNRLELVT